MEQLTKVKEFLWVQRFWLAIGVAALLAMATYQGSSKLYKETKSVESKYEGTLKRLASTLRQGELPNQKWLDVVEDKQEELQKQINDVWAKQYIKQRERMTWPYVEKKIIDERTLKPEQIIKRPFASQIADDQNKYLVHYMDHAYTPQYVKLYEMLRPLKLNADGNAVEGVLSVNTNLENGVFHVRDWRQINPTSEQAWLAQEYYWMQKAVTDIIVETNKDASAWHDAPIRSLLRVEIGPNAESSFRKSNGGSAQLVDYKVQQQVNSQQRIGGNPAFVPVQPPNVGGQNNTMIIEPVRYLESNKYYRVVPIWVSMYVSQTNVPKVLASFNNGPFRFTVIQSSVRVPDPEKVMPNELRQVKLGEKTVRAKEDTVKLDLLGEARIYKKPDFLQKQEEAQAAANTRG